MSANNRNISRFTIAALLLAAMPSIAAAQGELVTIGFQSAPPYRMAWSGGSREMEVVTGSPDRQGPKQAGNLWDFAHNLNGGYQNRPFMRFFWWDWDVSGAGHDSHPAGWTEASSPFRPAGGWAQFGQGPFYLRFRMRINAPILAHASNGQCDGDTQMKFFIWNTFTGEGTDRVIMMLHNGAFGGGNDNTETTVQLRAGVSGSFAQTRFPNGDWVHLQMGWRWGPESTGFQRIYVNNNDVNAPNAHNNQFNDLDFAGRPADHWGPTTGPTGLDNQFHIGDITNTGSCVREDARIDVMDVELATQFDSAWFPSGLPAKPTNLRIVPPGMMAFAGQMLLPFAALAVMLGTRGLRQDRH